MGMVFGKSSTEEPAFELLHQDAASQLEVRFYTQSSVMAYTDCPGGVGSADTNKAFYALAKYIGVFSTPQNIATTGPPIAGSVPEPISMTAPVLMSNSGGAPAPATQSGADAAPEAISMTAPVLMSHSTDAPEAISMTAPVLMSHATDSAAAAATCDSGTAETAPPATTTTTTTTTMAFVLPSKYSMENAPRPTNLAVKLAEMPPYVAFVQTFNGRATAAQFEEVAAGLEERIRDRGLTPAEWRSAQYNPPFTIPYFRRNEVIFQVREGAEEVRRATAAVQAAAAASADAGGAAAAKGTGAATHL